MQKRGNFPKAIHLILIFLIIVVTGVIYIIVKDTFPDKAEEKIMSPMSIDADIKEILINASSNNITLKVKRNPGYGNLTGIKFTFSNGTDIEEVKRNTSIKELERMEFTIHLKKINVSEIIEISISPLVKIEELDEEIEGKVVYTSSRDYVKGNDDGKTSSSEKSKSRKDAGKNNESQKKIPVIVNITLKAKSPYEVEILWSVDEEVEDVEFFIYRNGEYIGKTSGLNYSDSGLAPSKTYLYQISAYKGVEESKSPAASITTPPIVEIKYDMYGGCSNCGISGNSTGKFHTEKIGKRWWIITPLGNPIFIKAVSMVDTTDFGGNGGFLSYDAVYLRDSSGKFSENLKKAAENSIEKDVIHALTNKTLSKIGDEIYIGDRKKIAHTYFWANQLGEGGNVKWYYSTSKGWKLINGDGNPSRGEKINADKSYNLDIGGWLAPNSDGFGVWNQKEANRISWWSKGKIPSDFEKTRIEGKDSEPRYYIRGIVTKEFTVSPVINQIYERAYLKESILNKYESYSKWAEAITRRFDSWGFNSAGMYSYRYENEDRGLSKRLPVEKTWQLSGWAMKKPYNVKSIYDGAVCPPGSSNIRWQGGQADIFDPLYEKAMKSEVLLKNNSIDEWTYLLIPEEADQLFGINLESHDHLGYIILSQNPYREFSKGGFNYTDKKLYSKYALRDFLRYRYRDLNDPIPAFGVKQKVPFYNYSKIPSGYELIALENLNNAWNTTYTTWDTSLGNLEDGTNAWGTGGGFMDENGRGIYTGVCSLSYKSNFTNSNFPSIRKDLDDFVMFFAKKYGEILKSALDQIDHPPVFLPLYNAPDYVYETLSPYVDGFWVSGTGGLWASGTGAAPIEKIKNIYDVSKKPIILGDYFESTLDSPSGFNGTIDSIEYDSERKRTIIYSSDAKFIFRSNQMIWFPEVKKTEFKGGGCGYLFFTPRIKKAGWNTFELEGNYAGCVAPGMKFEIADRYGRGPFMFKTRSEMAEGMIEYYNSTLNLKGNDGVYFVTGFEHWSLYDNEVSDWGEVIAFGLATTSDNAYDGVEAVKVVGKDKEGYEIGGEERDYGNLLGPLGDYLREIYLKLEY